tara:strand:+ start:1638 stop:1925 length:288 start_codon:yes stop_codon:yes gene_type:complete
MLKKLFVEAIPSLAQATASVLKDHKGKVSSKRVFSIFGGGSLITVGLTVIDQGIASSNDKVLYAGLGLVGLGVAAGYLASFNIKEISNSADQTPQ